MTNRYYLLFPVLVSFMAGVFFVDFMYKDVPRTQVAIEKSPSEVQTQTNLLQCQALAKTIVRYDAQIIGSTNDLLYSEDALYNHKQPTYPDRLQDIYNLQDQRQPVLDSINNLLKQES